MSIASLPYQSAALAEQADPAQAGAVGQSCVQRLRQAPRVAGESLCCPPETLFLTLLGKIRQASNAANKATPEATKPRQRPKSSCPAATKFLYSRMPILTHGTRPDLRFNDGRVDKLTNLHAKHKEILRAVATTGKKFTELAPQFGVTPQNLSDIANSEVGRAEIARISNARDEQADVITDANKKIAIKALAMLETMVDGYVLMPDVEKLNVQMAEHGLSVLPVPPAERRRIAMGIVGEANKIIARQTYSQSLTSPDEIEAMKRDAIANGFVVAEDARFEDI